MSDTVMLEGREYVSAKRAAELSGYARDYIGQLARGGVIGAQRMGGLWYISMDSLKQYQQNAENYTPEQPQRVTQDLDAIVSFDGKDYISASRAAKLTSYHQDYIGQLARAGKILSRQVGNRWYVEKEGLMSHKAQKDSLLAAVQREAVGLPTNTSTHEKATEPDTGTFFNYLPEKDLDLLPKLSDIPTQASSKARAIPIHRMQPSPIQVRDIVPKTTSIQKSRRHGKTMFRATKVAAVLTFVIVLSYGLVTLKSSSLYAFNAAGLKEKFANSALAVSAGSSLEKIAALVEEWLSKELLYSRSH